MQMAAVEGVPSATVNFMMEHLFFNVAEYAPAPVKASFEGL